MVPWRDHDKKMRKILNPLPLRPQPIWEFKNFLVIERSFHFKNIEFQILSPTLMLPYVRGTLIFNVFKSYTRWRYARFCFWSKTWDFIFGYWLSKFLVFDCLIAIFLIFGNMLAKKINTILNYQIRIWLHLYYVGAYQLTDQSPIGGQCFPWRPSSSPSFGAICAMILFFVFTSDFLAAACGFTSEMNHVSSKNPI